jgi:site-specific recombinase XerD
LHFATPEAAWKFVEQIDHLKDAGFTPDELNWLVAAAIAPSLIHKRVSPHVLRHSTAMRLLESGVDCSVIALWLGHETLETTQIYLHASLELKERALAKTQSPSGQMRRYRPPDGLMSFLNSL